MTVTEEQPEESDGNMAPRNTTGRKIFHWNTRSVALVALATFLVGLFSSWNYHKKYPPGTWESDFWADASGYYVYLPGFFCHGFRAAGMSDSLQHATGDAFNLDRGKDRILDKYSIGPSLLELPFYLIAEGITGRCATNGFSVTHQRSMEAGGMFYWVLSLVLLGLALQRLHPAAWWVPVATFALITFGANLFYYVLRMPGFGHIYSFFALVVAFYAMVTGLLKDGRKNWLFSFACALVLLIRPTDAIAIAGLHLWLLWDRPSLLLKWSFWLRHTVAMAIVWAPQLMYWRYVHGSWFVYSYGHETFVNWRSPFIAEFLFAPWNGWFTHAPVLLLIPFGFMSMYRQGLKRQVWMIIGALAITVYLCASWWDWQFGCSYGSRPLVQYLVFLALPVWLLLAKQGRGAARARWFWLPLLLVLAFVNYRNMMEFPSCFFGEHAWDWGTYGRNIAKTMGLE